MRTLRTWFKVDDEVLLGQTYTYFSKLMPTEVLPRPEGLEVAWDEIPAEQREGRSYQPQDIVDASLAREVPLTAERAVIIQPSSRTHDGGVVVARLWAGAVEHPRAHRLVDVAGT